MLFFSRLQWKRSPATGSSPVVPKVMKSEIHFSSCLVVWGASTCITHVNIIWLTTDSSINAYNALFILLCYKLRGNICPRICWKDRETKSCEYFPTFTDIFFKHDDCITHNSSKFHRNTPTRLLTGNRDLLDRVKVTFKAWNTLIPLVNMSSEVFSYESLVHAVSAAVVS